MAQSSPLKKEAADHAEDLSRELKAAAKAKAEEHVEKVQTATADKVGNAADAAQAAAREFDPATFQAEAMRQIADRIDAFGTQIRQSDLETVATQVGSFARKNPVLFVGAAAALGFAATRFLKASDPQTTPRTTNDPWGTSEHPAPVISEMNEEHRNG
ncbi:MAG: hypothetical protein ACU0GG_12300 [Paracoccaceae bacterium]